MSQIHRAGVLRIHKTKLGIFPDLQDGFIIQVHNGAKTGFANLDGISILDCSTQLCFFRKGVHAHSFECDIPFRFDESGDHICLQL